jgi:outer membrane protein assembly factor BamE (lipoprotein component of BamABCDE complex)
LVLFAVLDVARNFGMLGLMGRLMHAGCHGLFLIALLVASMLSGCVTDSDPGSYRPRLRGGMSRDDLRACFGKPLRIEAAPAGGEDWYYNFAFSSAAQAETSTTYDSSGARTDSVSVSVSDTKSAQECPIHLSSDGYVIEPIPEGNIVR